MVDRARFDQNYVPSLIAVSNADGVTPVTVWADPSTHGLISSATLGGSAIPASGLSSAAAVQIVDGSGNQITSFGGGTQYTDGGVPPAHPIGGTIEWSDGSNWQTVSTAKPLPVTASLSTPADTAPATQNITVVDSSSTSAAGANNQTIVSGTATAGSAASFTLSSIETVRVEITGVWTGTLTSEISMDGGTTWTAQGLHQGAYTTSTFTAVFIGGANVTGATNFRIRATATITGTATVKVIESVNTQSVYVANAAPSGNVVSVLNSSATTLLANATYTGTGEDSSNFAEIRVSVISNVASATNGLSMQQSSDNTNWDITDTYTIAAATGATFTVPRQARWFRVVYTNGGTNQTSFRLQTILNRTGTAPSSNRAGDAYTNETDLEQNQSFLMGYNGTTWDRLRTTGTGVLSASAAQGTAAALTGGWPTINGEAADVTGTFTNATQTTSVTANSLDGYGNTLISINGTYGTATAIFEGSDDGGTTWYTVQAARDNTNVIETGYTSQTNTSQTWQINNPGFDSLRVRSTAVASGTVNVRLSSSAAPVASGTIVGLGTAIPSGTNVIGHVIADSGSTTAVTQATAASLNATVVGTGTFVTQSTLAAETTKVIGTVNQGTSPWVSNSNSATASAVPANAYYKGLQAKTANPTAASDGNLVGALADKLGKQVVVGSIRDLKVNQVTTITASASETTVLTSVASTFLDVYGCIVTNTSATAVTVAFKDSTAGTTQYNLAVPAGDTRGFMLPESGAIKQGTVTNNWTATTQSVTSVIVTMLAVKNI